MKISVLLLLPVCLLNSITTFADDRNPPTGSYPESGPGGRILGTSLGAATGFLFGSLFTIACFQEGGCEKRNAAVVVPLASIFGGLAGYVMSTRFTPDGDYISRRIDGMVEGGRVGFRAQHREGDSLHRLRLSSIPGLGSDPRPADAVLFGASVERCEDLDWERAREQLRRAVR